MMKKFHTTKLTTACAAIFALIMATHAHAETAVKKNKFDPTMLTAEDSESQIDLNKKSTDTATIKSIEKNGKRYTAIDPSEYAKTVNEAEWSPNTKVNTALTAKIQVLLDQNHTSVGAIDGGWGANSKQALINFQKIKNLPATGKMDQLTWQALTKNEQPALVTYTITKDDVGGFKSLPSSNEARSKLKDLGYENIQEKLAERFHMRIDYLTKINPNKKFVVGDTITVVNTGESLDGKFDKLIADQNSKSLLAYQNGQLVASYPATIGNTTTKIANGIYQPTKKVKMPQFKATDTAKDGTKTTHILPPGANSPVGVVWISLNKSGYGIHGISNPEIVSQKSAQGSIGLTNWDVLEVYANLDDNATIEIK